MVNRFLGIRWAGAIRVLGLIAGLIACQTGFGAPSNRPFLVIENVKVVDVVHGRIEEGRTVLIADGRIAAVSEPGTSAVPTNAIRIDGGGKYLIPGLMDMHVHLFNNASGRPPNDWTFPLFVANGVTAIREMNARVADMPTIARWRAALSRGELRAPRLIAVGIAVQADSAEAARRQVHEARAAKADFIKVFSGVGESNWRAILDEASQVEMPVCGHIPVEVSVLEAARAGQRGNEHLTQIYEACSAMEKQYLARRRGRDGKEAVRLREAQMRQILIDYNPQICRRIIPELASTGQVQVPTLALPHFEARVDRTQFRDDPRFRLLRADEQERWQEILQGETRDAAMDSERWAVSREIVRTLRNAGARILAGSDTPMPLVYPGFGLHKELELLVECGLTPAEALRAATCWPAEFLGQAEHSGSIEAGKRADLVLLDDDPLRQITNTQRIHAVILDGRWLPRTELDALVKGKEL